MSCIEWLIEWLIRAYYVKQQMYHGMFQNSRKMKIWWNGFHRHFKPSDRWTKHDSLSFFTFYWLVQAFRQLWFHCNPLAETWQFQNINQADTVKKYSRNLKILPFKIQCKGVDNKEQFLTKESFPQREQFYNCFFTLCDFTGKGTAECWSQPKGSCIFYWNGMG